jgi:hypothetical protein
MEWRGRGLEGRRFDHVKKREGKDDVRVKGRKERRSKAVTMEDRRKE